MKKSEAIQRFLANQPYEMAKLYNANMEVQVNVAADSGELITGTYAGKRWQGYTDGLQTWKHIRIPWNASTDPQYVDTNINFDISIHAEAIGMTGWDWVNKKSIWVGFDFDSIIGHTEGLDQHEIQTIQRKLERVSFVTLYSSTRGLGLHVYTFIANSPDVRTHTEHAAIARAVLDKISALTGLELKAKVDTLGGNMWVWHRDAIPDSSFTSLSVGDKLDKIPDNWKDYLSQVSHGRVRNVGAHFDEDSLVAAKNTITLEEDHIKLLEYLDTSRALAWYNKDKQMLVCHTYDLKIAHRHLNFKGFYDTVSTGKDQGHDQNCFAFPLEHGAWIVRRHSKGTKEHPHWFLDRSGWRTCYFNRTPNLRESSQVIGGVEGEKNYQFNNLNSACRVLLAMGIDCDEPPGFKNRKAWISELKDGRVKVTFKKEEDDCVEGWVEKKDVWERVFFHSKVIDEAELPDHLVRHLVSNDSDLGWFVNTNNKWILESKSNTTSVLISTGCKRADIDTILGQCILRNWKLVNKPFQPEYTGNREWNKGATQLKVSPQPGEHPYWDKVLEHCGRGLNDGLKESEWAKRNGINTGYLYLQSWCATLIQNPNKSLPYLFLAGKQNTGKSILHEGLYLLFTGGVVRADQALNNSSGFNGELSNAILCIVEESNLSKRGWAADRIKDWVTAQNLTIHTKGRTPYEIQNTTHWIQCANDPDYCPIFYGDTRITMINVESLKDSAEIPKPILLKHLEEEAPAFLYTLLDFDLPTQEGRLGVPVIETKEKQEQMEYYRSQLEVFIEQFVFEIPGQVILLKDFFQRFTEYIDPEERNNWTSRKVAKQLPFEKGRYGGNGNIYIGNISFNKEAKAGPILKKKGDRLSPSTI